MALTPEQKQAIRIITADNPNVDCWAQIGASDEYALAEIARFAPQYLERAEKAAAHVILWQGLIV
jgi:hypothetical protein